MAVHTHLDTTLPVEQRVGALLAVMTLDEKIGQMTQPEKNSILPEDVTSYAIGSVLSGGGGNPVPNNPSSWAAMVRAFLGAAQNTRLKIPLIYGVDAVHGHNNMREAVIFPHNIGLGATRDADLVSRVGRVTAREMLAVNVHWDFAPAVSVPQDIRWGRTFEGYSQDTALVTELGVAYLRGLQNNEGNTPFAGEHPVMASVKHYVADGGTGWGSKKTQDWVKFVWQAPDDRWSIDQGDADIDEDTLRAVHLPPYKAAIEAGAVNIMVSYSSWKGIKMHGHKYLLTDVLKNELGFQGFLVSDWMGINQLEPDYYQCIVRSINAGLDMVMVPYDYKLFIGLLRQAVEKGAIPMSRIDDAVRRILRAKMMLGLFEKPFGDESLLSEVGSAAHREVAREAVRKSLVLLRHENNALPLKKDISALFVAGRGADDLGMQCGGWSIEWMGKLGRLTEGTTILQAIRAVVGDGVDVVHNPVGEYPRGTRAPVGIAVVGETPYAEGDGDRAKPVLSAEDVRVVKKLRNYVDHLVVIVFSGRPIIITEIVDLCDALVAAWLPGTEGAGVSDVLFGDYPFTGQLPHDWPRNLSQIPLADLRASHESPLFRFGDGEVTGD